MRLGESLHPCGTEPGLQAGSTHSPHARPRAWRTTGQAGAWPYLGTRSMTFRWSRGRDGQHHAPRDVARAPLWLLLAASACTVTRIPSTPAPQPSAPVQTRTPTPQPTPQAQPARGGGPWQYTPAGGTYSYVITTDATIARVDSAAPLRTLPTTTQRVTLAIFSTGDVQLVDPSTPTSDAPCDAAAALAARALELVPHVPTTLSAGATWSDSTTTRGCRGTIPTATHTQSRYTVIGDTVIGSTTALQVHRADSISAHGEGTQGQHRITLDATGTASTELFLDPASGRFLGADETQQTSVDVTTSGRTERFLQHVHERATLAPGTSPVSPPTP